MKFARSKILLVIFTIALLGAGSFFLFPNDRVDFNTEVKPLFNKKCIACHGGVKQSGGFSILFQEEALAKTESGKYAIVPGNPDASELISRITSKDPDARMPYKHEPLSKEEVKLLRNWIKQGAPWGQHWAYVPVKQEKVPALDDAWVRNDIDQFILERLKADDLKPTAEADKATLLRRVSLDLTGVPPSNVTAQKFLQDQSGKAYENLVDDLLASPRYGERWTSLWLDLSRYADTKGYEADLGRSIWKYRDWLIQAFNKDQPYASFLTEQLAGDLLPNPTDAMHIATAFHRNTLTNDEGGTDNEEFRVAAVMDRVNTTWSALMGTTFSCVQCHSHPYDPFKHEEYYQFMAFFNNTRDEDTPVDYPLLRQFTAPADSAKLVWLTRWLHENISPQQSKYYYNLVKTWQPVINSLQCDDYVNAALVSNSLAGLRKNGTCRLKNVVLDGKRELLFRYRSHWPDGKWSIYLDSLKGRLLQTVSLQDTKNQWKVSPVQLPELTGMHNLYFKYQSHALKNDDDNGVIFDWFHLGNPFPGKGKTGYDSAFKYFNELFYAPAENTPVMVESNHELFRPTHIFERGSWLSKGDEVKPEVPHVLNPMPADAPRNRLGLALWLTDEKNPLTARTMVNRLWEQLFGAGIAETLEDLGTQGIPPTHKTLLDHLSWKFMHDHRWSIKELLKEIVMSATYRQRSVVTADLLAKDPNNTLYARGPRVRLSAEQLRDQALAVCDLLSQKMYGPGVMPYQPAGIWRSPYNGADWKQSEGEDQYRRALYTYWKRTAGYPSMITFDAGPRDVCIVRRIRTNTPLQALATLNDSAYLQIARHFAVRMQEVGGKDLDAQVRAGYEKMVYKPISANKLNALRELYHQSIQQFNSNTREAAMLLGKPDKSFQANDTHTAALVVVANAMLNLDEWVTKN